MFPVLWSCYLYMSSFDKLSCWSGHDNLVSPRYYKIYNNNSDKILELKFKKDFLFLIFFSIIVSSVCQVNLITASTAFSEYLVNFFIPSYFVTVVVAVFSKVAIV